MSRICFITAIYSDYEKSCKKCVEQTIPTDYICFTDNPNLINNGWIIDTTPYHMTHNVLDKKKYVNSMSNNTHTFNIAKYYKQSFRHIPILKKYDVIVWIDGSLEIIYEKISEYILSKIQEAKVIGWSHEHRNGILLNELIVSHKSGRYSTKRWNKQNQPYQDIDTQYETYMKDGYTDAYWVNQQNTNINLGVWVTCFVAFLQHDKEVKKFLDLWYLQTLKHTTQDQMGFSYVCYKTKLTPLTLPNEEIEGEFPHTKTQFYIKHEHGK